MIEVIKRFFGMDNIVHNRLIEFAESDPKEDKKQLGFHAKELLINPAFDAAIKRVEHDFFSMWKSSKPGQTDERELLWRNLTALTEIKLKLQGMVNEMLIEKDKEKEKKPKK